MVDDDRNAERVELKARYGIDRLPLDVGPGWFRLVRQFLDEARVAGELGGLKIHQIKEKCGELRIYHDGSRYLQRVSSRLGDVSAGVCELCGDAGRLRTDGFGVCTRCDRCAGPGVFDTSA